MYYSRQEAWQIVPSKEKRKRGQERSEEEKKQEAVVNGERIGCVGGNSRTRKRKAWFCPRCVDGICLARPEPRYVSGPENPQCSKQETQTQTDNDDKHESINEVKGLFHLRSHQR